MIQLEKKADLYDGVSQNPKMGDHAHTRCSVLGAQRRGSFLQPTAVSGQRHAMDEVENSVQFAQRLARSRKYVRIMVGSDGHGLDQIGLGIFKLGIFKLGIFKLGLFNKKLHRFAGTARGDSPQGQPPFPVIFIPIWI
jgi:hypothetical protein